MAIEWSVVADSPPSEPNSSRRRNCARATKQASTSSRARRLPGKRRRLVSKSRSQRCSTRCRRRWAHRDLVRVDQRLDGLAVEDLGCARQQQLLRCLGRGSQFHLAAHRAVAQEHLQERRHDGRHAIRFGCPGPGERRQSDRLADEAADPVGAGERAAGDRRLTEHARHHAPLLGVDRGELAQRRRRQWSPHRQRMFGIHAGAREQHVAGARVRSGRIGQVDRRGVGTGRIHERPDDVDGDQRLVAWTQLHPFEPEAASSSTTATASLRISPGMNRHCSRTPSCSRFSRTSFSRLPNPASDAE
jgi:hypothetical protein